MPAEKITFTHTDGRLFAFVGTTPHTTKDGRSIVLNVWDTCCSSPGCSARLVVKTATHTPWEWPNFQPAKFCDRHRAVARKAGGEVRQKARAEGLARWRESEKGKAMLAQRAADVMGAVEKTIYDRAVALSLTEETVDWVALRRTLVESMAAPAEGARDTRWQRITRALYSLMEKGRVSHRNGVLKVLR